MVRQYKIHTNLDSLDNITYDVTNGKIRFYQPSNLGIDIENNISVTDGIGVVGSKNLTQPDIEFKLETFYDTVKENYEMLNKFINDLLSVPFVTLEYSTESFQVYADLALKNVTKTEGYGHNGQFSETISFQVVTKWYTYENLTFEQIQNGQVISGKSKIYGGYKGNETALQNYNRLKSNPSLNLPNLNLLEGTKDFSGTWYNTSSWYKNGTYKGLNVMSFNTGDNIGIVKPFNIPSDGIYSMSMLVKVKSGSIGQFIIEATGKPAIIIDVTDTGGEFFTQSYTGTFTTGQTVSMYFRFKSSEIIVKDGLSVAGHKIESGSTATPYMPSSSELTTDDISEYFGYNYIRNQAYTYYGETNIERLSRWDIQQDIFSFVARLVPHSVQDIYGTVFLDENGNEYTAIIFNPEELQDYIMINTDVNDEYYQGWSGTTAINLFPVLDFERYRTRIIKKGQMTLYNLSQAEFKIKRKADFI